MDKHTFGTEDLVLEEKDGIAVLAFSAKNKKVNTLSSKLIAPFGEILDFVEKSSHLQALVIISRKKDCFIAGADIEELQAAQSIEEVQAFSRNGQELFNRIEGFSKPVVAAISGSCMGGGLELALACHYRIASDNPKTSLALPEVMLGLLPGAGGTQRLPALIGLEKALSMMLTGSGQSAHKAYKLGLVDYITQADQLETVAVQAAKKLFSKKIAHKSKDNTSVTDLLEKNSLGRKFILQKAMESVEKKTRGLYPAPKAIIQVIAHGLEHGKIAGYRKETEEFARLAQTPEAKQLMSIYFGQTELKKNRYGTPEKSIKDLAILGAGLMGSGIAQISLQKQFQVRLKDLEQERLTKARKSVWDDLNKKVRRRSLTAFQAQKQMSSLYTQTDFENFSRCELVIEAVFEDLQLKHQVIREIEAHIPEHCIFASNTSALPISEIAKASKRPENVLGMHYFSPVPKMPLLEIVVTPQTSQRAASLAVDVGLRQGKTVIVVKDGPGFYTTRILAPYMDEAALLILEGMKFKALDDMMLLFGFPVGPMKLIDEVGIDVAFHVSHDLGKAFGKRVTTNDPNLLQDLINAGALGRKSKKGFYDYTEKDPNILQKIFIHEKSERSVNPVAEKLVAKYMIKSQSNLNDSLMIQKRLLYRMINEACYCLQDGILSSALDGDIGAVFGLGFPPFLGGPFRYIDSQGVRKVHEELNRFADTYGERFKPCSLLTEMAEKNKRFY